MNNYPEYVKVEDKKYKINTDFRIAIECQDIATDENINDYERPLAIIYKLFGDEGINTPQHYEKLLELAVKYLSCGKEVDNQINEEPDMDFIQDMDYIEASFMSDYNIDLTNIEMHWWKFYNLINGLSNSEMGNCCVLNRVRNLRTYDTKDIKDPKELEKIKKAKEQVALKKKVVKKDLTTKQQKNIDNFYKMTGIERKE
ncbi:MAG: hypothetical protein IJ371_06485 [Clostridia bacterium]|nr:hypothetical protein [Clostridia bacterium]MBQ8425764.1 hypothetical protein [Clostridia bacterium]